MNSKSNKTIVWFRDDLRLADNPSLYVAARRGEILPLFIFDQSATKFPLGSATRWWLNNSLNSLNDELAKKGGGLIVKKGDSLSVLTEVLKSTKSTAIFWNIRFEPEFFEQDEAIKNELQKSGIEIQTFNASLLFDPREIINKQGKAFQVFTPCWRHIFSKIEEQNVASAAKNRVCEL